MRAYERFIKYVQVHTASSEESTATPTTPWQFDLTHMLAEEMKQIGMVDVFEDEHAYVYGRIPASEGFENKAKIGFIAHLDTVPDFCGENVKPQLIENYDGCDVVLGESGRVLSVEKFPHLSSLKGHTLITTDGTTVLGGDDKAGIAEIMSACEKIIAENIPHGEIAVCFTPDEEVGHGASYLDIERLSVDFAYTVDGEALDEINYETFNAAAARFEVKGVNVHPGSAKNMMVNASLVAMEINSMLPSGDTPANTEGYEGFFHMMEMKGGVEKAELNYIVRDHSGAKFEMRKDMLRHIEALINEKYGEGTAVLSMHEQYRNMAEKFEGREDIIALAKTAIKRAGLEPVAAPVRGGTDGAQLSYRGLLCPNVGTGGYACHGPYEHITAENMDVAVNIILNIVDENIK